MPHHNITIVCLFVLLNLASFQFGGVVSEAQVRCFFIFGDSLVDNGNNNYQDTTAKVNYLPYGVDFPGGPTGRFTNGRNTVDFIAQMLGFDKSIPPFADATDEDIHRGVNYGSGGAGILDDSGSIFGDVVSLNEQLANHEAVIWRLGTLLGSKKAAKKHLNSCVYYMGMGSNDYLGNFLPKYYASATNYSPQQFAALAIAQYAKQLLRLYLNGARKVGVIAVGKVGCIPQQLGSYPVSNSTGCVETSNDAAQIFNEKLQILIRGLNLLPAAKFLYINVLTDNQSGNIRVVDEPCCPVSEERMGHCVVGGTPCSNRDEYFFWDSFHPTEAAVSLSAGAVYDAMSSLYTNTNTTPTRLLDVS